MLAIVAHDAENGMLAWITIRMPQDWLGTAGQVLAGAVPAAAVWAFFYWAERPAVANTASIRAAFAKSVEATFGPRAFSWHGFARFTLISFVLFLTMLLLSFVLSIGSHPGEVAIWIVSIGLMAILCFVASLLPNYFCLALARLFLAWKSWFAAAILLDILLSLILSVVGSAFLVSMAVGRGVPSWGGMAGLLDIYYYLWNVAGPLAALSLLAPAFLCPLGLGLYAVSTLVRRATKSHSSVGFIAGLLVAAAWEIYVILRRLL